MKTLTEQYFVNEQSDFFWYMIENRLFKSRQTYRDYISRLRYASQFFRIDDTLTREKITEISDYLKNTIPQRDRYNTVKGVDDIVSGLNRFLEYVESGYKKKINDSILSENTKIENDLFLNSTEKEAVIKSRVGQGLFRQSLIEYWQGCSVTRCQNYQLLVASHIKPWRVCDNKERLDVFNGLLLTPNIDKLFDRGYISFSDEGKIIVSGFLSQNDREALGLNPSICLYSVDEKHLQYLRYHRENCFL